MIAPTSLEAERQVALARNDFARFLSIWASQLLELERTGSCVPSLEPIASVDEYDDWSIAA